MARKNDMTEMMGMVEIMTDAKVLRGKWIAVTGHLGVTRDRFAEFVTRHGGMLARDVRDGNPADFLVTNQDWTAKTISDGASRKLLKAQSAGVRIISEKDFYIMVAELAEKSAT